jgi:hypothetical protein
VQRVGVADHRGPHGRPVGMHQHGFEPAHGAGEIERLVLGQSDLGNERPGFRPLSAPPSW